MCIMHRIWLPHPVCSLPHPVRCILCNPCHILCKIMWTPHPVYVYYAQDMATTSCVQFTTSCAPHPVQPLPYPVQHCDCYPVLHTGCGDLRTGYGMRAPHRIYVLLSQGPIAAQGLSVLIWPTSAGCASSPVHPCPGCRVRDT